MTEAKRISPLKSLQLYLFSYWGPVAHSAMGIRGGSVTYLWIWAYSTSAHARPDHHTFSIQIRYQSL